METLRERWYRAYAGAPSTFTTPIVTTATAPPIEIVPLPPEPLTVITVPEDTNPYQFSEFCKAVKEHFKEDGMGKVMIVTRGTTVERIGAPIRQIETDERGNILYCTHCHEYQRPTPSGHCPGCGAGMAGVR